MKNKAFTMSEALIVLSVVSVLAALSVTAVSNAKPDESIIMFRKAYSMTTRIVNEMLNDKELYPYANEPDDEESALGSAYNMLGLGDSTVTATMKTNHPYLTCSVDDCDYYTKFADIFVHKANPLTVEQVQTSSGHGSMLSSSTCNNMTTPDGMFWSICSRARNLHVWITISVYTKGENAGCFYNATNCKVPTNFKFQLLHTSLTTPAPFDGSIEISDPMACSYLRYPKITKANKIPTDSNVNSCFAKNWSE